MKRYLLDTHLIYWWMTADARLGKATQRIIAKSEIIVSAVSMWEMVLKNTKGKLPLPQSSITEQLEAQGFIILPILPRHIEAVRNLQCVARSLDLEWRPQLDYSIDAVAALMRFPVHF